MKAFLIGLKNYQTTATGFLALLCGALSQAYPDWSGVFTKAAEGFGLIFVILTKDANTGSAPS